MNEARHQEVLQPIYPPYLNAQYVEDEISLVDVWITLKQKSGVFLKVFSAVLIVGVLYAFFVFQERHALVTTIQIGSIEKEGSIQPIETPESLLGKVNSALVPQAMQRWLVKNPEFGTFNTDISNPKKSDIMVVTNKINPQQLAFYQDFQHSLADAIVKDHARRITLLQSDLVLELNQARSQLKKLQDPQTLLDLLRKPEVQLEAARVKLKKLEQSYTQYQEKGKAGMVRKIQMEELKKLNPASDEMSDQLLDLQYEQLLLDSQLSIDQQNLRITELKLTIDRIKKDFAESIERQQVKVNELETRLNNYNKTRVVGQPVLSIQPVGLNQNILLALVVVVAFMLGFAAVLVAVFRDKTHQRELELS